MNSHDITGAKTIVNGLCRLGIQWHRHPCRNVAWSRTYETIRDAFVIFERVEAVESKFLKTDKCTGAISGEINGPFILLAPPQSCPHIVCLLGITWNLQVDQQEMGLYLNMFGASQLHGQTTWHRGYRIEMAHRNGSHDYSHVQPIRETGRIKKKPVMFTDPGVPDKFPSFPLPGDDLTTLCASLAVALEGRVMLAKVIQWLKGNPYQKKVATFLK